MGKERRPTITAVGLKRPKIELDNEGVENKAIELLGLEEPTEELTKQKRLAGIIFGIQQRAWCDESEYTSTLGTSAAAKAMKMAGISAKKIKNIFLANGMPNYQGVPTSSRIQADLKVSNDALTRDFRVACPGFVHALHTAYLNASSRYGNEGAQLVVASETPSKRGIQPSQLETFFVFGDGAGAVVIENIEVDESLPDAKFAWRSYGQYETDLYVPYGGSVAPLTHENLDKGGIIMKETVGLLAEKGMTDPAVEVLKKSGLSVDDISLLIPHQANKRLIKQTAKKLGFPLEKVFINIDKWGNTSAASIPIAITEAYLQGRIKNGDILLLITFGAGMVSTAAVIPVYGLPERDKIYDAA